MEEGTGPRELNMETQRSPSAGLRARLRAVVSLLLAVALIVQPALALEGLPAACSDGGASSDCCCAPVEVPDPAGCCAPEEAPAPVLQVECDCESVPHPGPQPAPAAVRVADVAAEDAFSRWIDGGANRPAARAPDSAEHASPGRLGAPSGSHGPPRECPRLRTLVVRGLAAFLAALSVARN